MTESTDDLTLRIRDEVRRADERRERAWEGLRNSSLSVSGSILVLSFLLLNINPGGGGTGYLVSAWAFLALSLTFGFAAHIVDYRLTHGITLDYVKLLNLQLRVTREIEEPTPSAAEALALKSKLDKDTDARSTWEGRGDWAIYLSLISLAGGVILLLAFGVVSLT